MKKEKIVADQYKTAPSQCDYINWSLAADRLEEIGPVDITPSMYVRLYNEMVYRHPQRAHYDKS